MTAVRAINRLTRRHAARRSLRATYFVILFILFSSAATAQTTTTTHATDGHTPLEIAPGSPAGSYALSDFDNISLFNQSIGFRLPLLRVGGRGEAGYTITLPIERKWRVTHTVHDPNIPNCPACETHPVEHHYKPQSNWYTALKPDFSPGVMIVRMSGQDPGEIKTCGTVYRKTLARLAFVAPDGTEYELRDTRFGGEPRGTTGSCAGENRGRVFVTADGASATFVADADVIDFPMPLGDAEQVSIEVSGYLYLRDGTRYHISHNVVDVIRDRNGNEVRFYPSVPAPDRPGVYIQKAIDSMGREVFIDPEAGEITYRGFGGAARTLRIRYAPLHDRLRQLNNEHGAEPLQTLGQLFPSLPVNGEDDAVFLSQPFDDAVVSEVVLPDGRSYGFRYNSYGELARVELPTGSAFEYDYQADPGVINIGDDYEIFRRVVGKRVYDEGGHLEGVTTFTGSGVSPVAGGDSTVRVDQLDPDPNASQQCAQTPAGTNYHLVSRTVHYFHGVPGPGLFTLPTHYTRWDEGREYRTESYACDGTTLLRQVNQEWRQKGTVGWWVNFDSTRGPEPSNDPRVVETLTTLSDTGQVSKTTSISPLDGSVGFDQYNDPTDLWEYDYDASAPLRHTKTAYVTTNDVNGQDYTGGETPMPAGVYLRGLPLQKSVYEVRANLSEVERSRTRYEYDNYAGGGRAPLTPHGDIFGLCLIRDVITEGCQMPSSAAFATRGNVTATTGYLLSDDGAVTGSITSYAQYDVAGNVVKAVDALGRETSFDFDDEFGAPDGESHSNSAPAELGSLKAYALPKSVTDAAGFVSYVQYDYYLGRPVDGEDINGAHTLLYYNDLLDRLTKGVRAFGAAEQSQTTINYNDSARTITVTSDLNAYNDNVLKAESVYDGLGRTVKTRKYEDASQYILTEQKYDAVGRASESSNPYRPASGESPVWTTTKYDALGRISSVTTPDGATGYTLYHGARTLVTDQARRQRISRTDALGRLAEVWEVRSEDAASGTEHVTFPIAQGGPVPQMSDGYRTSYSYDVLGNLRTATQGVQTRSFVYDSLSRLVSARNPESGTVEYRYDSNGNLTLKIDSRARFGDTTLSTCPVPYEGDRVATCYEYDSLNRLKSRSYNDGTPDVTYTYDDSAAANSKGRLTSVGSSVSSYSYGAYDALGRVKSSSQSTGGVTYTMPDYRYDLAGNLTSEKYPSGRVVETKYDVAGRVSGVMNPANGLFYAGAQPTESVNRMQYTAAGALSSVRLGNGLWEHTAFNSRLQPEQISLGTSATDSSVLKLDYTYGEVVGGVADSTRNNGNLRSQSITVPGLATPLVQSYVYDALNRLQSAEEKGGAATTWKQVYAYDRYGNRTLDAGTTYPAQLDATNNPSIGTADNRITSSGYTYDEAGNLLCDPTHQCGGGNLSSPNLTVDHTYFGYDAEGRMVRAGAGGTNASDGGTSYLYDGDGRRVRKSTYNGEETDFVYDAGGRVVAEYSNEVEAKGTRYLTQDHLGSTRVITDGQGNAHSNNGAGGSRHDYLPFGEELYADTTGRTTSRGYSMSDGIRQGFTGYEKDGETGLNYAKARYQSPAIGRFISPDPYGPWAMSEAKKIAFLASPQQWNRYAYVINNPLRLKDPTGLEVYDTETVSEDRQKRIHEALVRISKNGTAEQQKIADYILKNDVLISVIGSGSTIEGGAHINNSDAANADIAKGWVSMERAASHIGISINAYQLADTPERAASLESTLVHEGRHAFGLARTISSLSARVGEVFDPTEYRNEFESYMSEAHYLKKQGGIYHEVGLGGSGNYDLLKNDGNNITVNAERIKEIIATGYGVTEQNQGPTSTEKYQLRMPKK
jgi:RHS repeat-associated protein